MSGREPLLEFVMGSARARWIAIAVPSLVTVLMAAGDLGGGVLDELLLHLPGADKVLHVVQSGVLSLLIYGLLGLTSIAMGNRAVLAGAIVVGATIVDEIQQQWVVLRSVEVADIAAGVCGVALAGAVLLRRRSSVAAVVATSAVLGGAAITYRSYSLAADYHRGILAARAGHQAEALSYYLRAVESGVKNPALFNAAAWSIAHDGIGDVTQAVSLAERSLALRPGDPDTLDTYGWALYRAGRPVDAAAALERALALKPEIYCIHYHLGVVYLGLGRREEGLRHLKEQVGLMPATEEARLSRDLLARFEAPRAKR